MNQKQRRAWCRQRGFKTVKNQRRIVNLARRGAKRKGKAIALNPLTFEREEIDEKRHQYIIMPCGMILSTCEAQGFTLMSYVFDKFLFEQKG